MLQAGLIRCNLTLTCNKERSLRDKVNSPGLLEDFPVATWTCLLQVKACLLQLGPLRGSPMGLQARGGAAIHPEVERISGLIPADVDALAEYREHLLRDIALCRQPSSSAVNP